MISFSRRTFTAGALAVASVSTVSAQTPRKGGTLRVGLPTGLPSLDVMATTDDAGRVVNLHIYEPLIGRNEKLEPAPMLAESWSVSPDGLVYTIKLRKGVTFHNGKVMTSADAKASIERYMRMSVRRRYLEDVAEVAAPDADTVTLRLKSARPLFMNNFSQPEVIVAIIPAEEVRKSQAEKYGGLFYLSVIGLVILCGLIAWFGWSVWSLRQIWTDVYVLNDPKRTEPDRIAAAERRTTSSPLVRQACSAHRQGTRRISCPRISSSGSPVSRVSIMRSRRTTARAATI